MGHASGVYRSTESRRGSGGGGGYREHVHPLDLSKIGLTNRPKITRPMPSGRNEGGGGGSGGLNPSQMCKKVCKF